MSLRSPLGRVQGLGSAKSGSSHWIGQRITAVALTLLGLWFVVSLLMLGGLGRERVTAWLGSPLRSVLAVLFVLVAAWHANLGLQVIVEDYVGARGMRVAVLVVVKFALIVAAVAGVLAVLRIAFGVAA
jgi:succinate dehydrogenase / fumarate reductase, membrane anchor subunit